MPPSHTAWSSLEESKNDFPRMPVGIIVCLLTLTFTFKDRRGSCSKSIGIY